MSSEPESPYSTLADFLHTPMQDILPALSTALYARIDPLGRLSEPNPALARLLEDQSATTFEDLLRPDDRQTWLRAVAQVRDFRKPRECRFALPLAPADDLDLIVRLWPEGEQAVWFLALPENDLFLELRTRARALHFERRRLGKRGRLDPLTGLGDRGRADRWLSLSVARARRLGLPLSCSMVDLDAFKTVNDTLGHLEGDRRLRAVAQVLAACRPRGLVARFGGDEFQVLWLGLDAPAALDAAERLRSAIRTALLQQGTASLGVASLKPDDDAWSLLARADAALVRAKRLGRDRVEFED